MEDAHARAARLLQAVERRRVPRHVTPPDPKRPVMTAPRLTLGETTDRTNWSTDLTAPRPSGGDAAVASIGATTVRVNQPVGPYIPITMSEARTLRTMWEPQLVMGIDDPDSISAVQRSWWLRAATRTADRPRRQPRRTALRPL